MSLLDDFIEQNRPGRGGDLPDPAQDNAFRVNIGEGYIPASLGINKSGIFWLDKVDFTISSRILALSVANSILFIVFEGGKLLRINLQKANDITEIEIPLAKSDSLGQPKLYVDPTARHVLISTPQGANFYRLEGWAKAKPLNKFKGMFITALAWNRSLMAVSGASTSTHPILLGTHSGEVWEAELQASDELFKSDIKYFHKAREDTSVYELPLQERVLGLHAEPFPVDPKTYFVIMTTQTRIYQFVSQVDLFTGGSDQSLFRQLFKNNAMNPNYQEIPGEGGAGTLYLYTKSRGLDIQAASSAIVWLTSMGIYYGELVYGSQKPGGSVVKGASLLPYPDDDGGAEASELPISAALTEFHIILLYKGRLKAICILNN
ncbi:tethering complex subunit, partial [Spiromyces aspiralis]